MQSIYETRAVVDDCISQVCGGLTAGLDIWEMAIHPMLLYNSECWLDISNETTQELENIQKKFYKCLFAVGSGCPTTALYWQTGGLKMKNRILMRKLLFLHHVATLPADTLAREVYEVQKKLDLPGLLQECKEFLVKHEITKLRHYSSFQWKNLVKCKIYEMNKCEIVSEMKSSQKMKDLDFDNIKFERQPYLLTLNLSEARMKLKINAFMTPTIKMNFPSDTEFTNQFWTCSGCAGSDGDGVGGGSGVAGRRDTQQHVLICPGYAELRDGIDLENDRDLVKYFTQVINRRQEEDKV